MTLRWRLPRLRLRWRRFEGERHLTLTLSWRSWWPVLCVSSREGRGGRVPFPRILRGGDRRIRHLGKADQPPEPLRRDVLAGVPQPPAVAAEPAPGHLDLQHD